MAEGQLTFHDARDETYKGDTLKDCKKAENSGKVR